MSKKVTRTKPITKAVAMKVLEVVDAGLARGLGRNVPGEMCVEAAVCYAMGEPHTDKPKCVMSLIRDTKIALNDNCVWKTSHYNDYDLTDAKTRSEALRRLAIAQLGSKGKITPTQWKRAIGSYLYETLDKKLIEEGKIARASLIKELEAAIKTLKAGKEDVYVEINYEADVYKPDNEGRDISGTSLFEELNVDDIEHAKRVCEDIVQILIKLKSPGTKFLYLTEKSKAKKPIKRLRVGNKTKRKDSVLVTFKKPAKRKIKK